MFGRASGVAPAQVEVLQMTIKKWLPQRSLEVKTCLLSNPLYKHGTNYNKATTKSIFAKYFLNGCSSTREVVQQKKPDPKPYETPLDGVTFVVGKAAPPT